MTKTKKIPTDTTIKGRTKIQEIATLIRSLTYNEMITLADALQANICSDPSSLEMADGLYAWAKSNV